MIKILEQSALRQAEYDKFFIQFLTRGGASESLVDYRTRCIAECCGDVSTVDHNGRTLLHWATIDGNIEAVKRLISLGADINARCSLGNTPLHWVTCLWFDSNNDFAKLLVSNGADVNAQSKRGLTPLHLAAFYGKVESVKYLVSVGAKINACNNRFKFTPLHLAVRDIDTVLYLISVGAHIHVKNNWGHTPLHDAAWIGVLDVVKVLVVAGADINAKDDFDETPFDVARRNSQTEVIEYLSDLDVSHVPFRISTPYNLKGRIHVTQ